VIRVTERLYSFTKESLHLVRYKPSKIGLGLLSPARLKITLGQSIFGFSNKHETKEYDLSNVWHYAGDNKKPPLLAVFYWF